MGEPYDPSWNLARLLVDGAREREDAVALSQAGRTRTYGELERTSAQIAGALRATPELGAGCRVGVLAKDVPETVELFLGCARAGVVCVPLNWRLSADELAFIVSDAELAGMFVSREFRPKLEEQVLASTEHPHRVARTITLDGDEFTGWYQRFDPELDLPEPDPDDCVAQLYTSGTTGRPKGVQLAHRSFFAVVRGLQAAGDPWIGFTDSDVSLLAIPLFHIGGLWWAMTTLVFGARCEILPQFSGPAVLEAIENEGVTQVCLVPAMIQVCLEEPRRESTDLSTLACITYGGSPIPRPLLVAGKGAFGCRFAQIYGLTETGNTAVCLRPEDHEDEDSELLLAAGRPYPNVEVKVVDERGGAVPVRTPGQILIRSPANMLGYWKRPEATAETLRDGWIWTGDGGYLDERGYVYVHDRLKDMILYAGENVYPAEIESVLCAHPAVLEAAVIGVPDERWGELVKAICVLRDGRSATPAQLLAHCRGKLADFKLPRSVDFTDRLPRTPSGKIKKAELRAPYWQGRERQVN